MSESFPSDLALLQEAAQANESAFRMLYERYAARVFSFVLRMTTDHHEAEEILQETFLRTYRNAKKFKPRAKVSTWIFQIAMNLCRDRARRLPRKEKASNAFREPEGVHANPFEDVATTELQKIVMDIVHDLPKEEQSIFNLRTQEKLTYEEIAEIIGCSERTVRERMKKARGRFLARIEQVDQTLAEVLEHGMS